MGLRAHDPRLDSAVFAAGLYRPVDLEFSADGRLFVTEQPGKIKVFPNLDAAEPILVADFSKQIFPFLDTGMLGLAVHPAFPAEPYLYVAYALSEGTNPAARLVRITVDPATNQEVAGTRLVLLEGWCRNSRANGIHGVDDVVFGPDGALYVSAGDWSNAGDLTDTPACPDPPGYGGIFRSQDRQTPDDPQYHNGTVIRVDPLTGAAMAGNPFESSADQNLRYVIADGLRNPYRITFQPGTDTMWIGDVGEAAFEEINRIDDVNDAVVENFGWPCYEGVGPFGRGQGAQPELCATIATTPPVFEYRHRESAFAGDDCTPGSNGSSVSGLAFYEGGDYPPEYVGALFIADYSRSCVWAMLPDAGGNPDPSNMVTVLDSAPGPVDLAIGPGGDIFFTDVAGGKIHRIVSNFTPPPPTPVDPVNVAPFKPVQQSSNWDNLGPERAVDGLLNGTEQEVSHTEKDFQSWWQIDLTESVMIDEVVLWNRTDCCQERLTDFHVLVSETPFASFDLQATIAQAGVADYHYPGTAGRETRIPIQTNGRYVRVQLSGTNYLQLAEVEVFARPVGAGDPPVVSIDLPHHNFTWVTGSPIDFTGSAVTSAGETLPASALRWAVLLNHCIESINSCHQHQLQQINGASGSIQGPDHGYPASVELRLTATDPATGAFSSTSLTLQPQTVPLTFDTTPSGLELIAGENTNASPTPFVREFIIGSTVSMIAPISQTLDGAEMTFQSWSDGGGRVHSSPAPSSPTTYVAAYTPPTASNEPPVAANPGPQSNVEGDTVSVPISAIDPDNDSLAYEATGLPAGLSIHPSTGEIAGTTAPGSAGFYTTVVSIDDGQDVATVAFSWTVTAPNQDPSAQAQDLTTPYETALPITLSGSDPDGDALSFAIVAQPAHGSLSGTAPHVTYTPAAAYSGPDSFTFSVDDGQGGVAQATVLITVGAAPPPPPPPGTQIAESVTTTAINEWKTVQLANSYTSPVIVCTPEYGAGSPAVAPRIRNVSGSSFDLQLARMDNTSAPLNPLVTRCFVVEEGVYTIGADGIKLEAVKFVSTVTDRFRSWTGEARAYAQSYSSPVVVGQVMSSNDPRPSTFWARGVLPWTQPSSTTLYAGKSIGEDPVTERADETVGYIVMESGVRTIGGLTVEAGVGRNVFGFDLAPPYFIPTATSPTGAVLSAAGMAGDQGGWPLLYGPNAINGQQLQAAFDEDQFLDLERIHVAERVAYLAWTAPTGSNQAPIADAQSLTTPFETALPITLSGSDPDLDALLFAILSQPAHGSLSGAAPNLIYTPAAGYVGDDSFTFSVNDGRGGLAQAVVSITVGAAPNRPPTATPKTLTTPFETPLPITLTGSDPDADALTFAVVTPPAHGSLSGAAPNVAYTPDAGYSGPDSFVFSVDDGRGGVDQATVSITVSSQPLPPPPVGTLTAEGITTTAANQWKTVGLTNTYASPVIVCTPEYGAGSAAAAPRIRNVTATSFELQMARMDNANAPLSPLVTRCFVVEEGVYTVAEHGIQLEAVKFSSSVTDRFRSWNGEARAYANPYASPVVVGQVMSANDARPSTFWARGVLPWTPPTSTTLYVGKSIGEDPVTARADETVGYIVFEAGVGSIGGLTVEAGIGTNILGFDFSPPYPINIAGSPTGAVLSVAGMAGDQGGWPIFYGPNPIAPQRLGAAFDEDQFFDAERIHVGERVAYVAWTQP